MTVEHSASLDQLLPALIKAQGDFPAVFKDGYNPHFKSKFATLKSVKEATLPVLTAHDLSILQFPSAIDGKPALTTWLGHTSGQYIRDTTPLSMTKSDPQAQGSALTYLRRYGWSAVLGLVTDEDDDANAATFQVAPSPAVSKAQLEFNRVVDAAKKAGIPRADVESYFLKKYGTDIAPKVELFDALNGTVEWLTSGAKEGVAQ